MSVWLKQEEVQISSDKGKQQHRTSSTMIFVGTKGAKRGKKKHNSHLQRHRSRSHKITISFQIGLMWR